MQVITSLLSLLINVDKKSAAIKLFSTCSNETTRMRKAMSLRSGGGRVFRVVRASSMRLGYRTLTFRKTISCCKSSSVSEILLSILAKIFISSNRALYGKGVSAIPAILVKHTFLKNGTSVSFSLMS